MTVDPAEVVTTLLAAFGGGLIVGLFVVILDLLR